MRRNTCISVFSDTAFSDKYLFRGMSSSRKPEIVVLSSGAVMVKGLVVVTPRGAARGSENIQGDLSCRRFR